MILHHYDNSPYAEKIRLMFGFTNSRWLSLLSPAWPPRPNVDPLSGGYRRIPIGQLGADIFCDSSLIAQEIARMSNQPQLDPASVSGDTLALMQLAEGDGFFAAITALPAWKLLGTMLRNFGPAGAFRFVQDRSGLLKGGSSRAPQATEAREIIRDLFTRLEDRLSTAPWVGGDSPTAADFAVYHPIWLHLSCRGKLPPGAENVQRWYQKVGEFGHGERREITRDEAFEAAHSAQPRPLPAHDNSGGAEPGARVEVAPADYGVVPVAGTLAAVTADRIIVARETETFDTLHVHFPRAGYSITALD